MPHNEDIFKKISAFTAAEGLIWGICDASAPDGLDELLARADTPFVPKDRTLRTDPRRTMPGAKSIVVAGLGVKKRPAFVTDGEPRGIIAAGFIGPDYHAELRGRLTRLASFLPAETQIQVDNGPLAERAFAHRAGLGFYGKNGCLISRAFGSFFHIGLLLCDMPLPAAVSEDPASRCGSCRLCIDACPTGALTGGTPAVNPRACLSAVTQKKGPLTEREAQNLNGRLFGCDICQHVCPYNEEVPTASPDERNAYYPKLSDILTMTAADFDVRFGNTAAAWRGKGVLQRNARALADAQ